MADNNTKQGADLAAMNSATLGAQFPEITLPDGSKVQTGTVGALLANIRAYNTAHAAGDHPQTQALMASFRAALPLLDRVGLFDLFTPAEWMAGDNAGRKAVGRAYLEFKEGKGKGE
ncbi:hypothetical protein F4780DRAFT_325581 [Xylariomycetidae sp. FL0641]|nr:hypothetical protein F4780DRAFT_325581 [Xylariomycetidae sp. FL0641]